MQEKTAPAIMGEKAFLPPWPVNTWGKSLCGLSFHVIIRLALSARNGFYGLENTGVDVE
jgi:hypothetical protein